MTDYCNLTTQSQELKEIFSFGVATGEQIRLLGAVIFMKQSEVEVSQTSNKIIVEHMEAQAKFLGT